jgi:hypothetical protein
VTGVVISDILSDDLVNSDYSSSGPTLSLQVGTTYVWDVPGGLAPGAEGSIVITAQVDPSLATPKAILNEVQFSMNGYGPFQDDALIVVGGLRSHAPAVVYDYQ